MVDDSTPRRKLRALRLYLVPCSGLLAVFAAGIVFWGGFNWSLAATNSESFCIGCHEMKNNTYAEYRDSRHHTNGAGVRASCPDCHVPREWGPMVLRKLRATNELFHWAIGSIDTREKFLAKRESLAEIVWADMRANDSRECRNCHRFDYMNPAEQRPHAAARHADAARSGRTCIDCHWGIAHDLPEAFLDAQHDRFERDGVDCADCHENLSRAAPEDDWGDLDGPPLAIPRH
ncbi:MAG: NapC/NirT family cytochrome c [Gammaproteobacteria bacterium]|nr:NapC/NirT family cytochrome c [Gammaproteobacteria bacterium]MCP5135366.1 NapC/NirT family cytochrome c [Gammaproteobacteria bacterium]